MIKNNLFLKRVIIIAIIISLTILTSESALGRPIDDGSPPPSPKGRVESVSIRDQSGDTKITKGEELYITVSIRNVGTGDGSVGFFLELASLCVKSGKATKIIYP